ncbi:MAG: ABC transporter permease [Bacteroidales bacterium]
MNKIGIVIQREYLSRIQSRNFIISTIIVPLFPLMIIGVVLLLMSINENEDVVVGINDQYGNVETVLKSTANTKYIFVEEAHYRNAVQALKQNVGNYSLLVQIPADIENTESISVVYSKNPNMALVGRIESVVGTLVSMNKKQRLAARVDDESLMAEFYATQVKINSNNVKITERGDTKADSSAEFLSFLGYLLGIFMFMLVQMYGGMVGQSVLEEKSNKIVELILASVRPFQLLVGKVLGVSLVGLTQMFVWLSVGVIFVFLGNTTILPALSINDKVSDTTEMLVQQPEVEGALALGMDANIVALPNNELGRVLNVMMGVNWFKILGFGFLFLTFGFLVYSSLYAMIGSISDNAEQMGQYNLVVMSPMILSMMMLQVVMTNPDGSVASFVSYFPLTSPMCMMSRMVFDTPVYEVLISLSLLVVTCIVIQYITSRAYRATILARGVKLNWKNISRWLR